MVTPQDKAKSGVVVGMKALTGDVKPRVDIDVLLTQQPDTFNLMLQAISLMQKDPKQVGFYALAGIHGLPNAAWDEVYDKWDKRAGGYCAHGVLTFPTWHRPYLSLFEQTIYLKMVEIANTYKEPHRTRYVAACKEFRLPYLDYFRPRGGRVEFPGVVDGRVTSFPYDFRLPDIFNVQKVTIRTAPDDVADPEFVNPLYTYKFSDATGRLPRDDENSIKRRYSIQQTVRHPKDLTSTTHDLKSLSNSINSGRQNRTTLMLKLLNSPPYRSLSTVASDRLEDGDITLAPNVDEKTEDNSQGSGSLEGSVHGTYHLLIGGMNAVRGHMTDPTIAAFDPVFWFHHCNIDRYWAIWAAMHPKAWFPQPKSTSTVPENKKDLLPFYKSRTGAGQGTYHNSDDAKTTEAYGYFYDDFDNRVAGGAPLSPDELWKRFAGKYEWSTREVLDPTVTKPPANMAPLDVQSTQFFQKNPKPVNPVMKAASFVSSSVSAAAAPIMFQAQAVMADVAPSVQAAVENVTPAAPAVDREVPLSTQPIDKEVVPSTLHSSHRKINPKFDREWYVDSKVLRSASNGVFTIFFFLAKAGTINEDPATFSASPFLAGINHIFTAPREHCDNCGILEAAGQLATDTTLITPLLLDYLDLPENGLNSLRPEHVRPFLIEYLRWRVVYTDNDLHDARQVPDFKVNVSAEVFHDDGSRTYEDYPDIVGSILQNASAAPTT